MSKQLTYRIVNESGRYRGEAWTDDEIIFARTRLHATYTAARGELSEIVAGMPGYSLKWFDGELVR